MRTFQLKLRSINISNNSNERDDEKQPVLRLMQCFASVKSLFGVLVPIGSSITALVRSLRLVYEVVLACESEQSRRLAMMMKMNLHLHHHH